MSTVGALQRYIDIKDQSTSIASSYSRDIYYQSFIMELERRRSSSINDSIIRKHSLNRRMISRGRGSTSLVEVYGLWVGVIDCVVVLAFLSKNHTLIYAHEEGSSSRRPIIYI